MMAWWVAMSIVRECTDMKGFSVGYVNFRSTFCMYWCSYMGVMINQAKGVSNAENASMNSCHPMLLIPQLQFQPWANSKLLAHVQTMHAKLILFKVLLTLLLELFLSLFILLPQFFDDGLKRHQQLNKNAVASRYLTASASGFTPFSIIETQYDSVCRSRCVFYEIPVSDMSAVREG